MRALPLLVAALLFGTTVFHPLSGAQAATPATAPVQQEPAENGGVSRALFAAGAGAVVGIVAFNVLTGPLGVVPFAGGALQAVPYSVALGSRVIAGLSLGAGALAGNIAYDAWTGARSDYFYLLALGTGAVAGIVAGNYLAFGIPGSPPYYIGAGVAEAGGALASSAAQAASRVYVIGSAVLGAWAADYLYRFW